MVSINQTYLTKLEDNMDILKTKLIDILTKEEVENIHSLNLSGHEIDIFHKTNVGEIRDVMSWIQYHVVPFLQKTPTKTGHTSYQIKHYIEFYRDYYCPDVHVKIAFYLLGIQHYWVPHDRYYSSLVYPIKSDFYKYWDRMKQVNRYVSYSNALSKIKNNQIIYERIPNILTNNSLAKFDLTTKNELPEYIYGGTFTKEG